MQQENRDAAARLPLGQILVKRGLISHAELERALKLQGHSGEKLGRILAAWGLVSWEQIHRALDAQRPDEFIDKTRPGRSTPPSSKP